jgi:hypothetical protein
MSSKWLVGPKAAPLSLREIIAAPFVILGCGILAIGMLINGTMSFSDLKF